MTDLLNYAISINQMEQGLKNDLIATWNEAEELSASLSQLTNDEIIECKDSLLNRIENIKHWIGKYVSDEDVL